MWCDIQNYMFDLEMKIMSKHFTVKIINIDIYEFASLMTKCIVLVEGFSVKPHWLHPHAPKKTVN
jgi:hypothetical protein